MMKSLIVFVMSFAALTCYPGTNDVTINSTMLEKIVSIYNSTLSGRNQLHGKIVSQVIDTNALARIDTYEDGYVYRTAMQVKNSQVVESPPTNRVGNLPSRLRLIRAQRESIMSATNFVYASPGNSNRPKQHRTFSKFKAVLVLKEYGYWDQVKAWIDANGMTDLYNAASDFSEDNNYFIQGIATIKSQLGLSDEKVEEILKKCVAD